jgi:acetylornithine aminotransferase
MDHIFWCIGHTLLNEKIIRADNEFLFDQDGNRYIDLESGVWCTSIGHNHPAVATAISNRLNTIMHVGFCYADPVVEEAAIKVLGILRMPDGKAVFLTSGSDAVEFGVRIARAITDKPYLLMFSDSYFGAYGSASKKDPTEWVFFDWLSCQSCPQFASCDPECPKISALPFEKIGGMLYEPGSSSGLVRFAPEKLIRNLVDKTRKNNGTVIVNEVTTGIGRTGEWFGFQHYGFDPDIVATGKGIGNGYPVSVTAMNSAIAEKIEKVPFKYAQSHQYDPLGAEVVLAVLRTIEEEHLVERSRTLGEYIHTRLCDIQKHARVIKEIRGRGMMITIEFEKVSAEHSIAERIYHELYKRGIILALRPGYEVLRIDPCLTIHKESVETFLKVFEELLT